MARKTAVLAALLFVQQAVAQIGVAACWANKVAQKGSELEFARCAAMAIYHCHSKPISRSSGRSAVAAIAYRTQERLVDERQGLTHDYTRRSGVEYTELILPESADRDYWTREKLWNAAEMAEVRKDARTAREWELALPEELTPIARQELAVEFAQELSARYRCAVDVAVHAPDREGDNRNHHAHLLATTRRVVGEGLGDKVEIELSDAKRLSLGLGQGRQEIEAVRELWANKANQALEQHGIEQRIDHRSLAVQREEALMAGDIIRAASLDRAPEIKLGWKATAMERRGIETERGQLLQEIRQENPLRQALGRQIEKLQEAARQVGQYIAQGIEGLRERFEQWKQDHSSESRKETPLEEKREAFMDRFAEWKHQQEAEKKKPELEIEREPRIDRGYDRGGHGWEL